jgi:hypothetical protein
MAFGVTKAGAMSQNIRRSAGDYGNAVVNAMAHGIPNP